MTRNTPGPCLMGNSTIVRLGKTHSHIAMVVRPPPLKSFANQKNVSKHRVVIRRKMIKNSSFDTIKLT